MTLAELAVKLTANTAEFISGFSNAGVATKRFRADLSDHVQAIGGALDGVLSHFGEFGSAIGAALDGASQSAGRAITSFGAMGGAAGTLIGVGAGVAAAVGVVEVGMVGLAVKTALSIAKMGELAQSTGIAVGPLSGLSFVFKATGVEAEAGVKGIEKLDKAIFKAATSAPGSVNAFTRLGISVRDTQKNVKDADVVFAELAGKFENMKDGSVKTALAMELFGKGGAALVPALNKGKAGIEDLIETAKVLGVYLDDQTVQAAEHFKESLATIEAATTGLSYNLTRQLLPAIQTVADFLVSGLKDKTSGINAVIDGFVFLAKIVLATADTIWSALKQVGIAVGDLAAILIELATTELKVASSVSTGDFSGAIAAATDGYGRIKAVGKQFFEDSKKDWKDYAAFTAGIASPLAPADKSKKPQNLDVDTAAAKDPALERIKARIDALTQEAANWAKLASAGSQAEQLITEAIKKGDEEFGKLRAEAAKSPAATALVIKDEGLIKAAAAASVFGGEVKKVVSDLDKAGLKFDEQGKAADALAAAYAKGGAAIAAAAIDKKLEPERLEVERLAAEYALAKAKQDEYLAGRAKLNGAAGPVQGQNVDPAILKAGLDVASAKLEADREKQSVALAKELTESLIQQGAAVAGTKPYFDDLNNSYLQGETAVRKARIELELYRFAQGELAKGIVLTTEQKQKERAILEESDREAYDGALRQEAAQFSLNAQYDSQIVKLERLKEVLQENGQSTLLIDARLHDAQDSLIHQWDEAAFKVGTFSQKFKGVMGELVIQGRAAGAAISQAFVGAIDGIETQLAKLLTGQKTDFKAVFTNLAEQVTKAKIQQGVGAIAEKFGIHIPGLGAKADGSESNPFHVVLADATAKGAAGLGKGLGGLGSLLGGSDEDSAGTAGSGLGGLFSKSAGGGDILGLFQGLLGGGGGDGGGLFAGGAKKTTGKGAPAQPVMVVNPVSMIPLGLLRVTVIGPVAISGLAGGIPGTVGGNSSLTSLGISTALGKFGGGLSGLGGLASLFGGFRAEGGDMSPGSWYVAGEKGPEIVRGPGSVIPNHALGGRTTNITHNHNYPTAQSRDLFGFTEKQNQARQIRNSRLAYR